MNQVLKAYAYDWIRGIPARNDEQSEIYGIWEQDPDAALELIKSIDNGIRKVEVQEKSAPGRVHEETMNKKTEIYLYPVVKRNAEANSPDFEGWVQSDSENVKS